VIAETFGVGQATTPFFGSSTFGRHVQSVARRLTDEWPNSLTSDSGILTEGEIERMKRAVVDSVRLAA
jgi:hypothetical protein